MEVLINPGIDRPDSSMTSARKVIVSEGRWVLYQDPLCGDVGDVFIAHKHDFVYTDCIYTTYREKGLVICACCQTVAPDRLVKLAKLMR